MVERIEYKIREKLLFSKVAVEEYKDLHNKIEKTLSDTAELIKTDNEKIAKEILESESTLDALVDKYRANHIERSARGICDEWARVRYLDMLDLTREVARHCIEIADRFVKK